MACTEINDIPHERYEIVCCFGVAHSLAVMGGYFCYPSRMLYAIILGRGPAVARPR